MKSPCIVTVVAVLPDKAEVRLGRRTVQFTDPTGVVTAGPGNPPTPPEVAALPKSLETLPLRLEERQLSGKCEIKHSGSGFEVEISEVPSQLWQMALLAGGVPVKNEYDYILSFKARAAAPHGLHVVGQTGGPEEKYWPCGLKGDFWLTQEPQQFSVRFRPHMLRADYQVLFCPGTSPGKITVEELHLERVTGAPASTVDEDINFAGAWPRSLFHPYENAPARPYRCFMANLSFTDAPPDPELSPDYYRIMLSDDYPWAGQYFRSNSYGNLRIEREVTEWIQLPGSWKDYCTTKNGRVLYDPVRLALALQALHPVPPGTDVVIFNPSRQDEDPKARAYASSGIIQGREQRFVLFAHADSYASLLHELCHTLGIHHGRVIGTPKSGEAPRPWNCDYAGTIVARPPVHAGMIPGDLNSYNRWQAGWIHPARVCRAGHGFDRVVRLERLSEPATDGYLMALIVPDGQTRTYWTVEARMRSGRDFVSGGGEAVVIHECNPKQPIPDSPAAVVGAVDAEGKVDNNGARWEPGETYQNRLNGFSVQVLSRELTGFTLHIHVD